VSSAILIRRASPADVDIIARHRVKMFEDMGSLTPDAVEALRSETLAFLPEAIARDEYLGWLASTTVDTGRIVAGAGAQRRRVLPFPRRASDGRVRVAHGRQAIVLNVYTEPTFRRQGIARRLMLEILDWARVERLDSLVLHGSPDGRSLYEQLGFGATNEMRFAGDLTG
jgi:GNAT superfamily N-acetyltransferase